MFSNDKMVTKIFYFKHVLEFFFCFRKTLKVEYV